MAKFGAILALGILDAGNQPKYFKYRDDPKFLDR